MKIIYSLMIIFGVFVFSCDKQSVTTPNNSNNNSSSISEKKYNIYGLVTDENHQFNIHPA